MLSTKYRAIIFACFRQKQHQLYLKRARQVNVIEHTKCDIIKIVVASRSVLESVEVNIAKGNDSKVTV